MFEGPGGDDEGQINAFINDEVAAISWGAPSFPVPASQSPFNWQPPAAQPNDNFVGTSAHDVNQAFIQVAAPVHQAAAPVHQAAAPVHQAAAPVHQAPPDVLWHFCKPGEWFS